SFFFEAVVHSTLATLSLHDALPICFSDSDTSDRPFVAVVNEALVRKSFPNQSPLGRTIFCPFDSLEGMKIIGVVGDVRQRGPERSEEHTSELQSPYDLVCRLLLEKK